MLLLTVGTRVLLSVAHSIRFRVMFCSYGTLRSHSLDTPRSVGLLWTSDQPDAEASLPDNTQNSLETNIYAPGGIRTHIHRKRMAAGPRIRPYANIA